MIGRVLSHYRIVGALGAGGMGVIYRAEDDRLGRAVALKFLPDELAHDRQAIERLRAEARAASALNHSNICTVYDIGEDDGRPFIVMELLTGRNVRDLLASGPLKITQVVDIGIQIADALDAAHRDGIIHRDIKPANIFLTDRHQAKLLDFGVAKLTEARGASGSTTSSTGGAVDLTVPGVTVGTVAYMSPEQATGETLDGRTDLFSLGVVLYECATGHHPFTGKTTALVLSSILNRAPVAPVVLNPELPPHLQDIIQNCLEKDRELRYQSAADLRADLRRLRRDLESGLSRTIETDPGRTTVTLAATHAAHTVASQPREALPRRSSRRVGAWIAVGSIAVVLAVIGDVLIHRGQPTAPVLVPTVSPSASSPEPAAVESGGLGRGAARAGASPAGGRGHASGRAAGGTGASASVTPAGRSAGFALSFVIVVSFVAAAVVRRAVVPGWRVHRAAGVRERRAASVHQAARRPGVSAGAVAVESAGSRAVSSTGAAAGGERALGAAAPGTHGGAVWRAEIRADGRGGRGGHPPRALDVRTGDREQGHRALSLREAQPVERRAAASRRRIPRRDPAESRADRALHRSKGAAGGRRAEAGGHDHGRRARPDR